MTSMDLALRQFSDLVSWGHAGVFLLRLTAVAAAGSLGLGLLGRSSAAVRHRMAVATLAATLALPAAFLILPPLRLTLPAPKAATVDTPPHATGPLKITPAAFAAFDTKSGDQPARRLARSAAGAVSAATRRAARTLPRLPGPSRGAAALTLLAGLVGAGLLWRELRAEWAARRLARRAVPITDPALRDEFRAAHGRLNLTHAVELRQSAELAVPVVCGVWSHTLLLPGNAAEWSATRRQAVLLHELAHVQRRDGLWLALTRLAGAIFWFHPIVRRLTRQARLACEQACDDVVLTQGLRSSSYAQDLLALAHESRGLVGLGGVAPAFAQLSTLESRLTAILSPGARRGRAGRATTTAIGGVALMALLLAGSVRVGAAPAGSSTRVSEATWSDDTITEQAGTPVPVELACNDKCDEARKDDTCAGKAAAPGEPCPSDEARVHFERGREAYEAHRYPESAEAYQRAAAADYDRDTALYNAACSLALAGQTSQALDALERAVEAGFDQLELLASDEDLVSLRSEAAFARLLQDGRVAPAAPARRPSALERYSALRADDATGPAEWGAIGIELMRLGHYPVAVDAFQRQFAADSSATPLYNEGCAWALAGKSHFALGALERSILAGFEDADQLASDSDLVALHGDPRFERLVALTRRLQLHGPWPASENPAQWRALSTTAENLVREHPEIGRAWFNLGYTKLALREAEGTVDAFQRALTLGYRPATTSYNLACAHALLEQPDQALTWLSRAEAAGLKIADLALWDPDLSPLRSDPRFRAMAATWTRQRNAEWTEKLSEKSTEKRSKQRAERLAKLLLEQRK